MSWREIAKALGVGATTIRREFENAGGEK